MQEHSLEPCLFNILWYSYLTLSWSPSTSQRQRIKFSTLDTVGKKLDTPAKSETNWVVGHLFTVSLPCRKCHYSLIVQSHAVLPWRRTNIANFDSFHYAITCIFFFLLFQYLPKGCTFTVSLWSSWISSPGCFPIILKTGILANLHLHWFHHLYKGLCAQY